MAYPLVRRRAYVLKRRAYRRTARPLRTYSRSSYYKRRAPLRVYRRSAYRRTAYKTRGPKPIRVNQSKKSLRTLLKQNEDYTTMFTDGSTFTTNKENTTVIFDFQFAHQNDFQALYNGLPANSNNNAGKTNSSIVLKAGKFMVSYYNGSVEPVELKVWVLRAKRDTPCSAGDTQEFRPAVAWQKGVENSNAGNVGNTQTQGGYLHPFSHPTDSTYFNQMWAVVKLHTFQLLPGASRDITCYLGNMPYKTSGAIDLNSFVGGLQGITMAQLCQARGALCADSLQQLTYYSRPLIYTQENKRYQFTYAADWSKNLSYTVQGLANGLSTTNFVNPLNGVRNGAAQAVIATNTNAQPVIVQGTGSTSKSVAVGVQTATT